jgi:hypothetical protein
MHISSWVHFLWHITINWTAVSAVVAVVAVIVSLLANHATKKNIQTQLDIARINRNIDLAQQLYELNEKYILAISPTKKTSYIPKINSRAAVLKANGWEPDSVGDSAQNYDYRTSLKNFIKEQSIKLDDQQQKNYRKQKQKRVEEENKIKLSLL